MLKLTSQQFALVLESLQESARSSGHEKRQFTRIEVQTRLTLATLQDKKPVRVFTSLSRDISCTGVGLMQHEKFAPEEMFLACLPSGKGLLYMVCKAMFCRPLAEGIFTIGGQFESVASNELVDQFVSARDAVLAAAAAAAGKKA